MSTKDFRAAVAGEIQTWAAASYPTLPVVYENGPSADEDAIGPIWLDMEIRFYGGSIASVGVTPRMRQTGAVSLQVYYKEASGTGLSDDIVESLCTLLQARRLGGAVLLAPQRTVPSHLNGWYRTGVLIPFTLG